MIIGVSAGAAVHQVGKASPSAWKYAAPGRPSSRAFQNGSRKRSVILAAQPTKKFVEFYQLAGLMLYLVSDLGASANGAAFSIDGGWTAA